LKKPLLCVENEGYPLTPSLLALADSQLTEEPSWARYVVRGVVVPLPSPNGVVRPGLAQPPPG
jgi:hypothetical protein